MRVIVEFKKLKKWGQSYHLVSGISNIKLGNMSFNFGSKKNVLENRKHLCRYLKIKSDRLLEMDQVHGSRIKILRNSDIKKLKGNILLETDGLVTNLKNIFLMVKTADCFPVILFDPLKHVIAALHVGWKGAVNNILPKAMGKINKYFQSSPSDLYVGIGPGINKCCYQYDNFLQENNSSWKKFIINKKGHKFLDLQGFIIQELIDLGIKKEKIDCLNLCTCCQNEFFSHFRKHKAQENEGRFATVIGMRAACE